MNYRLMFDATGVNAATLKSIVPNPDMVAGYLTGDSGIPWTAQEWDLFPGVPHVGIDQGAAGSPQYQANVMDVEPGAFSVNDVPGWTGNCTAPRPTVYCDGSDLDGVLALWKGDIWLAAPNGSYPPVPPNPQVVAIQYQWLTYYDISIVYDPYWPDKKPESEPEMLNGQISQYQTAVNIPFPAGKFTQLLLMHDFTTVTVRVAMLENGKYTVTQHVVTPDAPVTIPVPATCVGISLVLVVANATPAGWTLS